MKIPVLSFLFLLFVSVIDAQSFQWANQIGVSANGYGSGKGVVTDLQGNIYTVGFFGDTAKVMIGSSNQVFISNGNQDIYVSKKNNGEWGRLTNIGSIVNSQYQDLSPFLLDGDTLTFISNRNEVGYEIFYTVFYNNTWTDPIKMNSLNTSKSEVSLTYDYNSTNFLLSATSDNKTNSDIFFYGNNKAKINLTFNLNTNATNGILYFNKDSILFLKNDVPILSTSLTSNFKDPFPYISNFLLKFLIIFVFF